MEVAYDLSMIFASPVQKLDRGALTRYSPKRYWVVPDIIDKMGALSTAAQGLKRQLTSYQKVLDTDEDQSVYILWEKHPDKEGTSVVIGLLKVGKKRLFLLDLKQNQYEATPLCVLDFYVHESKQRQGYGHILFDGMLVEEAAQAYTIAIDQPSNPLICFLAKHYQLEKPVWQATHFVVYPSFFEDYAAYSRDSRRAFHFQAGQAAKSEKAAPDSRSSSATASPRPLRDSAAGLIHGTAVIAARRIYGEDTPQGRKNTRDFGHTSLW